MKATKRVVSIPEQIEEVRRAIAERERTYPLHVAAGRISKDQAERQLENMRAVLDTLNKARR